MGLKKKVHISHLKVLHNKVLEIRDPVLLEQLNLDLDNLGDLLEVLLALLNFLLPISYVLDDISVITLESLINFLNDHVMDSWLTSTSQLKGKNIS